MIVAATCAVPATHESSTVFDSIMAKYQAPCNEYWVITQPDHARLSGAVAAAFDRERLPYVTDEVVRGIAAHDRGWLGLDGAAPNPILPPFEADGRLRSFLNTPPKLFLVAWTGSIQHAEQIGPTAGTMVSQHFERLAQFRLAQMRDTDEDVARLGHFLVQESSRQSRLCKGADARFAAERLQLLQFCDVISLYVCCRIESEVTIPQQLGAGPITIATRGGRTEVHGIPLRAELQTECPGYRWRSGSPSLVPAPIAVRVVAV